MKDDQVCMYMMMSMILLSKQTVGALINNNIGYNNNNIESNIYHQSLWKEGCIS